MRTISLTQGKTALVDDADFEWLSQWKWCARKNHAAWYALRNSSLKTGKARTILMHREISNPPLGMETDHKDHNGLNNQRHNLRVATHAQNMYNQRKRKGTSRFKGVCWHRNRHKWGAHIRIGVRRIHLGYFVSEVEAAQAYDQAARKHFGEFASLNF
jgi:hypothetical protein